MACLVAAVGVACDGSDEEREVTGPPVFESDWGPLAVVDGQFRGGTDKGNPPGTLQILEECVVYEGATLVWRDSQVSWDPAEREISFSYVSRRDIVLADGDVVGIETSVIEWHAQWYAEPAESCPRKRILVNQVQPYTLGGDVCQSLTPGPTGPIRSREGRCSWRP